MKYLIVLLACFIFESRTVQNSSSNSKETTIYTTPRTMAVKDMTTWDNIGLWMEKTKAKTIVLNWNGVGGFTWIGERFIQHMKAAQRQGKKVIVKVTKEAISMHAIVICNASSYIMLPKTTMTFHCAFCQSRGKPKQYIEEYKYFDSCKAKGILTSKEIYYIVKLHKRVVLHQDGKREVLEDWK